MTITPRPHNLCGTAINYTAKFDNVDITNAALASVAVTYTPASRTFSVYSADRTLKGTHTLAFTGVLASDASVKLAFSFTLVITDPCDFADDITLTA